MMSALLISSSNNYSLRTCTSLQAVGLMSSQSDRAPAVAVHAPAASSGDGGLIACCIGLVASMHFCFTSPMYPISGAFGAEKVESPTSDVTSASDETDSDAGWTSMPANTPASFWIYINPVEVCYDVHTSD